MVHFGRGQVDCAAARVETRRVVIDQRHLVDATLQQDVEHLLGRRVHVVLDEVEDELRPPRRLVSLHVVQVFGVGHEVVDRALAAKEVADGIATFAAFPDRSIDRPNHEADLFVQHLLTEPLPEHVALEAMRLAVLRLQPYRRLVEGERR